MERVPLSFFLLPAFGIHYGYRRRCYRLSALNPIVGFVRIVKGLRDPQDRNKGLEETEKTPALGVVSTASATGTGGHGMATEIGR